VRMKYVINNYYSFYFVRRSMKYGVIHKSFRDFRPVRHSIRDGHAEEEHVNRGRDTPGFSPTIQVLDMSMLGDMSST
jgi:hypothetical protein